MSFPTQPQRCYWRNLSKRSADNKELDDNLNSTSKPVLSESISLFQALEVYHEQDEKNAAESVKCEYQTVMRCLITDNHPTISIPQLNIPRMIWFVCEVEVLP